jgi:glycosyltransferase involved in cell wall biosynthesis
MRIAFASTSKSWGGGEQFLAHLMTGMVRAGQEVGLVARRGAAMASWAASAQVPLLLEIDRLGRMPGSIWAYRTWLRKHAFDVLVLNDPHAITSGGIASWQLPLARVGIRHTIFPVRSAWKHRNLVDHVLCVSQAAQQECIRAGVGAGRTSVVHCGVPVPSAELEAVAAVKRMFHNAAGAKTATRHLLGVGSLISVKGFDVTINALAAGIQAGKDWQLWIAGEGLLRDSLTALAARLNVANRVHLLGFRRDVAALMSAADVFVSASHCEGLPLVLVEAMLRGCPIVSTPVGGCAEALQANEANQSPFAEITAPGDVAGLATAIDRSLTLEPPAKDRVAAARHWALETFSIDRMVERHLQLYRQLVARRGDDRPTGSLRRAA